LAKAIETAGLTKEYSTKENGERKLVRAVDNVSLDVERKEFLGLLGPNGAGKTTFIKMLGTLVLPTSGSARVAGYDVVKEPDKARSSFGWLHGETGGRALYWRLTAFENLKFYAALQNVPWEIASRRIEVLLEFFDLTKERNRMVKDFSTGMKVRVMLARSLLANPPILLMDEPTVGLDPSSADETRRLLTALNEDLGKTILFTSHNMTEVERLVKRVAIMHKGRIIADESPSVLSKVHRDSEGIDLEIESDLDMGSLKSRVGSLPQVEAILSARETGSEYFLRLQVKDESRALYEIPEQLRELGIQLTSISRAKLGLEEVFLRLTRS
jgi:ABC-2 type transport system ATP-binding protein